MSYVKGQGIIKVDVSDYKSHKRNKRAHQSPPLEKDNQPRLVDKEITTKPSKLHLTLYQTIKSCIGPN